MGKGSKIEWCDHTFNPWRGCTKVSEGCKHCYAETLSARNPKVLGVWGPKGTRVLASESMWREPLKWNEEAKESGVRRRVFCASLADVFEGPETCSPEAYQIIQEGRRRLFCLILDTPDLDWLLLTKRPQNIIPALRGIQVLKRDNVWEHLWDNGAWRRHFPNVWLGTSVEDQKAADERIPELLKVPAPVRFLSCEPLLGPLNIWKYLCDECDQCERPMPVGIGGCFNPWDGDDDCDGRRRVLPKVNWVIAGGESGPHARPMYPDWARSLRNQCQSAGVPFLFKQWGEWISYAELELDTRGEIYPIRNGTRVIGVGKSEQEEMWRLGKHDAGRLLDGRTWDELPQGGCSHG